MKKQFFIRQKNGSRGQSFIELMLVTVILVFMLAGVVEFGYLLNSYLKILDGTREGARFSSVSDPYAYALDENGKRTEWIVGSNEVFYIRTIQEMIRVISPIVLNGNRGDDIVISIFSVTGNPPPVIVDRWPQGYITGWSLCSHYSLFEGIINFSDWNGCSAQSTNFADNEILALMDPYAPPSGVLLVELFYHYPQILKLPVFSDAIPDPIPVYTYSVMPIAKAEPTEIP
jgi:hypothetical protein